MCTSFPFSLDVAWIGYMCFILYVCLSAAQVYRDRDQFASLVREVAAPDVGRMGIEILSFTIKGTDDDQPRALYVCPGYEIDVTSNGPVKKGKKQIDNRQLPIEFLFFFSFQFWLDGIS